MARAIGHDLGFQGPDQSRVLKDGGTSMSVPWYLCTKRSALGEARRPPGRGVRPDSS